MTKYAQIRRLAGNGNHNLQRIGNTLAHLELHFNQLSTDIADAGMDEVPIPGDAEFMMGRFMTQLEQMRNACRVSAGLPPLNIMLPDESSRVKK